MVIAYMTEKLYYKDSHIHEFEANVLACREENGYYYVELDKTAFFPEGGGQSGDTGTINSLRVTDTQEYGDHIFHILLSPLTVGETVFCSLDWMNRFRRMQHHSGEHIISGLIHKKYGYDNVGFHLGEDAVTMDFNGELTQKELDEIEIQANEAIYKNIQITTRFPKPSYLKHLSYRSKLDLTENVRLVSIPGYDLCACCAPHVKRTGEIGIIKLLDTMRHRGGIRIRMKAGYDAFDDYRVKTSNVTAISVALSSPQDQTASAVERICGNLSEIKLENSKLRREILALKISTLKPTNGNICLFEDDLDTHLMRELVNAGVLLCSRACAVFAGNDKTGYKYVIGSKNLNLRDCTNEINCAVSGRGGGSSDMIQGSSNALRADIEKFFFNF